MRLIDGEALKEKFKEHYDLFVSGYKNEQDMSLADKSRVDEILNSMAEVINAPTVDVLDKIRAEIDSLEWWCNGEDYFVNRKAVGCILDKYKKE